MALMPDGDGWHVEGPLSERARVAFATLADDRRGLPLGRRGRRDDERLLIDPLTDRRWTDFVDNHPDASLFHCTSWLEALASPYNYVPIVLTNAASGHRLTDGIPFCGVKSSTGNRLISLPFSDHCDPLTDRQEATDAILAFLRQEISAGIWKVVELRPRRSTLWRHEQSGTVQAGQRFCLHTIDLTQACDAIEKRFHPSCVQRAIRRANREGLEYSEGSSRAARFVLSAVAHDPPSPRRPAAAV